TPRHNDFANVEELQRRIDEYWIVQESMKGLPEHTLAVFPAVLKSDLKEGETQGKGMKLARDGDTLTLNPAL
ncbi:unnamed protein product, partial [Mycena citricolor]